MIRNPWTVCSGGVGDILTDRSFGWLPGAVLSWDKGLVGMFVRLVVTLNPDG